MVVWGAADALVGVPDCTTDLFHTAWFGKKRVFAAALERAKHGNLFAAQKQSVCCPDAKMAVCGKCETT